MLGRGSTKRTSEQEAIEQLKKQRRQASNLQSEYKGMLKEINQLLKEDFTQIPSVLNALKDGTYKVSKLIPSSSSGASAGSADVFNHNVVTWKDVPVNFYFRKLLKIGFSEDTLSVMNGFGNGVALNIFLISYGLEGSWKVCSKKTEAASTALDLRHTRCNDRGAKLAKKATYSLVTSIPTERAFWFVFGAYTFLPLPAQEGGGFNNEHKFTEIEHVSGAKVMLPGRVTLEWTLNSAHSEKAAEVVSPDEVTRYKLHMLFRGNAAAPFKHSQVMEPVTDRLNEKGEVVAVEKAEEGGENAGSSLESAVERLVKARRGRKAAKK